MKKVIVNKSLTIQWRDILNGLLLAVLTSVLTFLQASMQGGEFVFNWSAIGMAAVAGGLAYLIKQFVSPPKVITTYDTNAQAKEVAQDLEKLK